MSDVRTWEGPSARERLAILARTRTVAIVGASDNPARASYFVATYLLSTSPYEIWFVNPRATEILGRPVYPSLADVPGTPDVVDSRPGPARSGSSSGCGTTTSPPGPRAPGSRWSWTAA
jgi:hypothetical protein